MFKEEIGITFKESLLIQSGDMSIIQVTVGLLICYLFITLFSLVSDLSNNQLSNHGKLQN